MKKITCIICPNGCSLSVSCLGDNWTVEGNLCTKGRDFALSEVTNPTRSIASTVRTIYADLPRLPVRTEGEIPLGTIFTAMKEINKVLIDKPVHMGEKVIENICGTGIDIIATADMYSAYSWEVKYEY